MNKKFTLTFAGDTSLGNWYFQKLEHPELLERLNKNPFSFFEGVIPLIEKSNYLILNLETVIKDNPANSLEDKKYPNWDHPTQMLDVLSRLGVTAVGLSNNHTMDFGPEVMLSTKNQLESIEIKTFVAGKDIQEASSPLKVELEGKYSKKNIYVLAGMKAGRRYREEYDFFASKEKPGINSLNQKEMSKEIAALRKKDPLGIIIVFPHWQGLDYKWASENPKIQERSRALIEAGSNYVLGHGPHIVNNIEKYQNGKIAYSIGNFIFNSPGRYQKMQAPPYSFIVTLEIEESEGGWNIDERFYPIISDNMSTGFRSRPVDENEAKEIVQLLKNGSCPQMQNAFTIKKDSRGFYFISDSQLSENLPNNNVTNIDYELFKPLIGRVPNTYTQEKCSTKKLFSDEFARLGYESKEIGKYLMVNTANGQLWFLETETSNTSLIGWRILKNKYISQKLFSESGLSVAKGNFFNNYQKEAAEKFALNLKRCVVKPVDGRKGAGITVGVSNKKDFENAWNNAIAVTSNGVLIEEQFIGVEAKYLVVGNKCVAVAKRIPPHVIGNGRDTLGVLIKKKNEARSKNPNLKRFLIKIDQHRLSVIENQGFKLNSIPNKDQIVLIDWKANVSTGAEPYDITDEVHPLFKEIAQQVSLTVPGLDVLSVDILAKDHTKEPNNSNYIIVEANTRPGIDTHHYPAYGKPRNIARLIVEHSLQRIKA